jgi:ribosomal protein S18 acetylase RimI-like enzyme
VTQGQFVISYRTGNNLNVEAVIELYKSCSLGARRPSDDRERMAAMLAHANLVVTAWDGELMVGISRSLTDFVYATYLSDLAVRESYQKRGIGRELIRRTQAAGGPKTTVILLAAPAAVNYYPRIGFTRHDSAWIIKGGEPLQ